METAEKLILVLGAAVLALVGTAMLSCTGPVALDKPMWEIDKGLASADEPAGGGIVRKTRYVTGVEYPQGYDWRSDLGFSAEGAVLFLMKGQERTVELPVGYSACISADADMHRCVEGHLYTDFSTDTETVIKKDGVEMFRYFDREMIVSLVEREDGIHTLGQPRSGTGWTYRRNGEIVLHKGAGSVLHGFHTDGSSLCFSYEDVISTSSGSKYLYYIVKDGSVQSVPVTDNISAVDDVISRDGELHYIAQVSGVTGRVLFCGPDTEALDLPPGASGVSGCSFVLGEDCLFVKGRISGGYGTGHGDSFWEGSTLLSSATVLYKVCGYAAGGGSCYYMMQPLADGYALRVFRDGETVSLPLEYDFVINSAFGAGGGSYCLGLTDTASGNAPVLWENDKPTAYSFNGVFTGVSYW